MRELDRCEDPLEPGRHRVPDHDALPPGLRRRLRDLIEPDADLTISVALYGFSQKEAARALGLSHEAARKRYQRATARLLNMVSEEDR